MDKNKSIKSFHRAAGNVPLNTDQVAIQKEAEIIKPVL